MTGDHTMAKEENIKQIPNNHSDTVPHLAHLVNSLKNTDILLEKLLTNIDEAVLLIDESNQIISSCNPLVTNIFGYAADELIGQKYSILLKNRAAETTFCKDLSAPFAQRGFFRTRQPLRHKNGAEINAEITCNPSQGINFSLAT
jgi:PAS domain S-box-containing protein